VTLLIAFVLIIHGGIHIGYPCGRAWPFDATAPWPVATFGLPSGPVHDAGITLAVIAFVAFLLAAMAAVGLLPSMSWRPAMLSGAVASAVLLVAFATPWTLPGLAIDAFVALAVVFRGWRPVRLVGGRRAGRSTHRLAAKDAQR
jgi:hypothetical protein